MASPLAAALSTKVVVHRPRRGAVSRRRVIDAARHSDARVVAVTAPAGYGKTTMVAEWAATEERPVAWASVDRFDDDSGALLTLLATACSTIMPHVAAIVPKMRGTREAVLGGAAPLLAAVLADAPEPFVLVADDLHAAGSQECQDALEVVLAGVPDGSQVVLTSRYEQPSLTRLRLTGATVEIGPQELRIDAEDARPIFDGHRVTVSDEDVATAVERCEGWPTGLVLCALTIRAGGEVRSLFGDERVVSDYLHHEVFARLSDDLQRFLRRTAILEELSGSLCDAVLDTTGSGALLQRVEEYNLFLIPLDRRRRRYRYHSLFREFLLARVQRDDGDIVRGLHLRAADWFEEHGRPRSAVGHLLAAGAPQRAGGLIATLAMPAYGSGQVALVDRWLREVGDAVIETSGDLLVIATWAALLQGRSPGSERWAAVLDAFDPDAESAKDRASFASARAMIRAVMCLDGPLRAREDATYAVAHEPEWSPWRDTALYLLGSTALLGGDTDAATDAFVRSSMCAGERGSTTSVVLSEAELALLAMDQDAWSTAEVHADRAVRRAEEHHLEGYALSAFAFAVAARVALRREDLSTAKGLLARAMRARVGCTHVLPFVAMRLRLQLAKAFSEMGDRSAALHVLREIEELLARRPDMGVLVDEIAGFRHSLVDTVERVATVPLTPAETRLLPYLQTHLTLAGIGERLFISRNTVSSEVGSIYRKLGVTTRSAAVERAIEGGLLGP
ncbi:LuxR C-terminal-related transcriptional regulator [Janibacter sp. GS2]|uniref:helix-turn-helix transcriptional regulator n=1 Tax=Janibacter sp. GS2 TaxID=3442646 RepID=UPI003EC0997F